MARSGRPPPRFVPSTSVNISLNSPLGSRGVASARFVRDPWESLCFALGPEWAFAPLGSHQGSTVLLRGQTGNAVVPGRWWPGIRLAGLFGSGSRASPFFTSDPFAATLK